MRELLTVENFQRDKGSMKLACLDRLRRFLHRGIRIVKLCLTCVLLPQVSVADDAQLSAEEQAWLADHPVIRLGVDPDWPPIEFFSSDRGYQGVTSEYIAYLKQKLMLEMPPVKGLVWADVLVLAQEREVDLLPALGKTPERSQYLNFTKPYLSFPFVAFTREGYPFINGLGDLSGKRVAVVRDYAVRELIEADFPGLKLVMVENPLEGLMRLSRGEVDAYTGNLAVGSYLIRKEGISNIKVGAPTAYRFELRMGVRKDWPELIPILQRLLDNMSDEQKMAIRDRWLSIRYDVGVDYSLLWQVVLVSLAVLGIAVAWLLQMRRQREALRRSEARYHLAMDAVSEAVWEWDLSTNRRYFSPGFFYHLGFDEGEIPQNDAQWRELIHPDDRDTQSECGQQVDKLDRPLVMEFRVRKKQGGYVDVRSRGKAVKRGLEGNSLLRRGTLRDITSQKQAESELRKLSEAVEHSPAMVIITDAEGTIEYVNSKFTEVTGYTAAEVLGENPRILRSGLTAKRVYEDLWETIKSGGEWRGEIQDRKKNGEIFWESISISVVKDAEGEITHYVGVKEDITVRKEAERLLAQAKEEAEQASRFKSSFLANMSHEIRTPVNAIMGMAYLAMQNDLNSQQLGYLEGIKSSARSLLAIIDDVLDLSKIEAGKMELKETGFQLDEWLENLSGMVKLKAQEKGLQIIFHRDPKVPGDLYGDPLRLTQVLSNFAQNAIKFTDTGKVEVVVELISLDTDSTDIAFSVRDTGIGIEPRNIPRLFDNFVQADSSASRQHGGAGLGLSISKQLIDLMHGKLEVKSKPGVGSEFRFVLNLKLQKSAEQPVLKPNELPRETPPAFEPLEGRVLLIEDNRINQRVAQEVLSNFGLQVEIAKEGHEAIEKLQNDRFDLVLMDIQMPGMDGYETTRLIRRDNRFTSLPILAMTAHVMEGARERCLAAGMNGYIPKPIEPERLWHLLRPWLNDVAEGQHSNCQDHADGLALLQGLPILDSEKGLARVGGNQKLFAKLLRDFLQDHADCGERINHLLRTNSISEACRHLHTLQGVSGTIGALELQQTSWNLGNALRGGVTRELDKHETVFYASLDQLLGEIQRDLKCGEQQDAIAGVSCLPGIVGKKCDILDAEIIRRIGILLQAGDPSVGHLLESLPATLDVSRADIADQLELLQNQAADYEYDEALHTLHRLSLTV